MIDQELQPLPQWMMPPAVQAAGGLAALRRQNEQSMFELCFQPILDRWVSEGGSFKSAVESDPHGLDYQKFMSWVLRDEDRRGRYYEAQGVAAEVVADQMIEIADATDSMEDVARSTLRITTRKWLLGVWNRRRFGDTKQIEQTVTINMAEAIAEAQARVDNSRIVDVQVKELK